MVSSSTPCWPWLRLITILPSAFCSGWKKLKAPTGNSSSTAARCRERLRRGALVERRPSLAQEVVDRDEELDRLELEIGDLCFDILARAQPTASDVRFITTAIKTVADIERIGKNGVNIARRALEIVH